uniref:Uncharacterized protein n=1 Tax=Haemonchus contortus TaxID=6289 RepID=W6NCY6_HAECO
MYFVAVLFAIIAVALGQIVVQTPLGSPLLPLGPGPVVVQGNSPLPLEPGPVVVQGLSQLPLGPGPVIVSGNSPLPPAVWPGILHISGSHPFGM